MIISRASVANVIGATVLVALAGVIGPILYWATVAAPPDWVWMVSLGCVVWFCIGPAFLGAPYREPTPEEREARMRWRPYYAVVPVRLSDAELAWLAWVEERQMPEWHPGGASTDMNGSPDWIEPHEEWRREYRRPAA